ncbi:MAG TPA: HAMP domain-containing protein, partial [Aliiroseovarius sp.]|nr:HAMP domain-containing protein [Aliiroseovarius sp.]
MRDTKEQTGTDVVLGEDWVDSPGSVDHEIRDGRSRRGFISINRSPLARKIITFNLLGLIVLVAGVLYLNPFRDSLVYQREIGLVAEVELIADVFEAQGFAGPDQQLAGATLNALDLRDGIDVYVYDAQGALLASTESQTRDPAPPVAGLDRQERTPLITGMLNWVWEKISGIFAPSTPTGDSENLQSRAAALAAEALSGTTQIKTGQKADGGTMFSVATPIKQNGTPVGVVAISSASGALDSLVRSEREQVLQMFVIAILVSIGLSLLLASTIANPLSDLATAAEIGRDKNSRNVNPGRVRIPDLTGRPDEIGRLSTAMRGMVNALYDRIDANEQFAADVAHEIKNPL